MQFIKRSEEYAREKTILPGSSSGARVTQLPSNKPDSKQIRTGIMKGVGLCKHWIRN